MLQHRTWARVWSIVRIAMAVLIASAIISQLIQSISIAVDNDRDVVTTLVNFFSYFTILSNLLSVIVLTWAAIWFWTRGREALEEPPMLARALAATTTYMVVTGIVYNTLLRGIALAPGTSVPWTNEVLHVAGPIFLALDLFLGPLRQRLPWRAVWTIVGVPIVWVAYTLVRGPLVTNPVTGDPSWYPYPFLNPGNFDSGYLGVSVYVVGIACAIIAIALFVVWIGRRRGVSPAREAGRAAIGRAAG